MFLLAVHRRCFFCGLFLLFVFCVCRIFLSMWPPAGNMAGVLAHLCVMFYCVLLLSNLVSWVRCGA